MHMHASPRPPTASCMHGAHRCKCKGRACKGRVCKGRVCAYTSSQGLVRQPPPRPLPEGEAQGNDHNEVTPLRAQLCTGRRAPAIDHPTQGTAPICSIDLRAHGCAHGIGIWMCTGTGHMDVHTACAVGMRRGDAHGACAWGMRMGYVHGACAWGMCIWHVHMAYAYGT
jgi:hypothetical protein